MRRISEPQTFRCRRAFTLDVVPQESGIGCVPKPTNSEALKLPDPLLVRYFRDDKIAGIKKVTNDPKTHDVKVTLADGAVEKWKHVSDWLPDI